MEKLKKYSEYRHAVREEARKSVLLLLEDDPVVDVLNANLGPDLIAVRDAKKGKPTKVMIVKASDTVTKPPTADGKLNSGWTKVLGGLTVSNDRDYEKYQKQAQEKEAQENEGKGENDRKIKYVVTTDPFVQ